MSSIKRYFVASLLIVSLSAHSQNLTKDTILLKEVEIRDQRVDLKKSSAIPLHQINKTALEKMPSATVAEIVRTFPGVVLKDYGGIGGLKTISVRSLGANHTGVFLDGVAMNDAQTGQTDLSRINAELLEAVSLRVGQAMQDCQPARSYSTASTLNLHSISSTFDTMGSQVKVGIKTGSFGLLRPSFSFSKGIRSKITTGISGAYSKANGRYPYRFATGSTHDAILLRENSDIESLQLYGYVNVRVYDSSSLKVSGSFYDSERGLPGAVVLYNPRAAQRLWNRDMMVNLQFENNATRNRRFRSQATFTRQWLRYLDPDYHSQQEGLDNTYLQHGYYLSQAFSQKFPENIQLSLAQDVFLNTLTTNLPLHPEPSRITSFTVAAVQWNANRFMFQGNLLATMVREKVKSGQAAAGREKLSPSVAMGFRITESPVLRLRLSYQDIFRMPTFNDLYYALSGNHQLLPETAKQFNAGLMLHWQGKNSSEFSVGIDGYYNQVKDKIVAVPTQNLFAWSMRNLGKVAMKGLEVNAELEGAISEKWRGSLSIAYSLQQALDMTQKGSTVYKQQIPYIPYETLSTSAGIEYGSFAINYYLLFNGFRYVLGENIYDNMLPGWWLHDISATASLPFHTHEFKFKLAMNNILGHQYEVIRSFPMPGRSIDFSVIFSY